MKKKGTFADSIHCANHPNYPLILKGFLVGVCSGVVVIAYRIVLSYAERFLTAILDVTRNHPVRIALWFAFLLILAILVGRLVQYEPLISGSGIPQLKGEMNGELDAKWHRVLWAKFTGGALSLFAGLSLGREGPSIQLGAMTGKGVSKALRLNKTEEKYMLTCGAGAGLAAAFNAPLAGVLFSLEEIHKNFSAPILVSVMTATATAGVLSAHLMGGSPAFSIVPTLLPYHHYSFVLVLGVIMGLFGVFYNWFTLKMQSLYRNAKYLNKVTAMLIPFLLAGVLGYVMPSVLGSGHELVHHLTDGAFTLRMVLILLAAKFIFSGICFGSGAPGGIFFPLLVMGALAGGIYSMVCSQLFGVPTEYLNNFVILAMAGFFTAIVRAPLTGIILIFEMTGSFSHLLSLTLVSLVAYAVASLLGSEPIYESLLENIRKNLSKTENPVDADTVLKSYIVSCGSEAENCALCNIEIPEHCLIVTITRNGKELIPRGQTILYSGDSLLTAIDTGHECTIHETLSRLTGN